MQIINAINSIIKESNNPNGTASFDQILDKFPGKFDTKTLK